jgi:predicted MFS family arabinose efflux permease
MISVFFFLPESMTDIHREAIMVQHHPTNTFRSLIAALNRPKIGPLLLIRSLVILAYTMFWSVFALFAQRKLNLTAKSIGFVLTFIGFYSVLVQGVGIRLLTKRFKDNTIIIMSLWLMFLGLVGWSLTTNLPVMLLVILPLAGGGWTLNTIVTSAITKAVDAKEIGGMLGVSTSLESTTRVIAPIIGVFMLGSFGIWVPAVFSAVVILWTIRLTYRHIVLMKVSVELQPAELSCA